MATYYDALNCTYRLFEIDPPPPSAQLIYVHLLHLNNRLGNTGTVKISDRELGLRTRLSKQTITEAKRQLKNRGLIDFKTDRDSPAKTTTYTLTFFSEKVGQELGQELGQEVGQEVGQSALFPIHTRAIEDKEERKKNKDEIQSRGREHLKVVENEEEEEIDELMEYWEHAGGAKLNQLILSELAALLKDHTMPKIKKAIDEASLGNNNPKYGFSLNYLKLKLSDIEKAEKGGVSNARRQQTIDYGEEPDTSWIKPLKRDNEQSES